MELMQRGSTRGWGVAMTAEPQRPISLVCAAGLGDAILTTALAEHSRVLGHASVLYSDALYPARTLFPEHRIERVPTGEHLEAVLRGPGRLFVGSKRYVVDELSLPENPARILYRKRYGNRAVHHLASLSARMIHAWGFGLEQPYATGIRSPGGSAERRHGVIAIHPTSAHSLKDWRMSGYRTLAERLVNDGFEVEWVTIPEQADSLRRVLGSDIHVAHTPTVIDLARTLVSVRALVAVDSGVGHLASALGTPTLSIFRKQSSARYWRPVFAPGEIVAPPFSLPTRLGARHWQGMLSVKRVHDALAGLLGRV